MEFTYSIWLNIEIQTPCTDCDLGGTSEPSQVFPVFVKGAQITSQGPLWSNETSSNSISGPATGNDAHFEMNCPGLYILSGGQTLFFLLDLIIFLC